MTISSEIPGAGSSTVSMNVAHITEASLARTTGPVAQGDGSTRTIYTHVTPANDRRLTVQITSRLLTRNFRGASYVARTVLVEVNGHSVATNSVDGSEKIVPIATSIRFDTPADAELADLSVMLQNAFGVVFPTAAAGVIDTTRLARMIVGVTEL